MTYTLDNQEKLDILNSRIRAIEIQRYNSYLSKLERQAIDALNADELEEIDNSLAALERQLSVLKTEADNLSIPQE